MVNGYPGLSEHTQASVRSKRNLEFVRVSDDGCNAVDVERQQLLSRIARDSARGGGRYGLGLHFVWLAAGEAGGALRCESNEHRGSVFTIRMPRASPA